VHDPAAALFHAARGTDVMLTVVKGRVLYSDGVVRTLDEAALAEAVLEPATRVREALA
jgi:5-methylthioadenosine/S-adenosylhomocysteine deaminase